MNKLDRAWTDEELVELAKLHRGGSTLQEIGDQLGRSRNSIAGKLYRLVTPRSQRSLGVPLRKRRKSVLDTVVNAIPVRPGDKDLMAIGPHDCRWPSGDGPFMFCGEAVLEMSPYCPYHTTKAYRYSSREVQPPAEGQHQGEDHTPER